jgi:predicted Zn-dependent protease
MYDVIDIPVKLQIKTSLITLLLCLPFSISSQAQVNDNIQLPDLGDTTSGLISLNQEYTLGRAWLATFRGQVKTVSDPLLQDYLETLIYRLATYSELKDRRLDLVIVDNPSMNAFAVPGGVVGVHTGLFSYADSEAQLASVLAHELGHLSQRHFARSVEAQQRASLPTMAGMLAGLVLAATTGGDAGIAAITATQAASLQNQLRFSRLHEKEADRVGMQTMVRADYDPNEVAGMFENMMKASRYAGNRPPEFLLTHPVTESRVSDARSRARKQPRQVYTDKVEYHLMKARIEVLGSRNTHETAKLFRDRIANNHQAEASHYGLALALAQSGNLQEAREITNRLRKTKPGEIAYIVALTEIDILDGQFQQAEQLLEKALSLIPDNHPLTMTLANSYLKSNQAHRAEALLKKHSESHPRDPALWYLLAETHGLAGNIVGVHQARAEYFILNGMLDKAKKQLSYALPLVKNENLTHSKIETRMAQIEQMKQVIKNL